MLSNSDLKLLATLLTASQDIVHQTLDLYLKKIYGEKQVFTTENYSYALGEIPIALVAHMDTVWSHPIVPLIDREGKIISADDGLGADDRAGIFAILKILQAGYKPSVILLRDEELGCVGADAFTMDFEHPAVPTNFLIELDRRGEKDAVFYECENFSFKEYICGNWDFYPALGSFTDISTIMPVWDRAGFNASVGYYKEHTSKEYLYIPHLENTIHKIKSILSENDIPLFKMEASDEVMKRISCDICGTKHSYLNILTVKGKNYCMACSQKHVSWCRHCGKPYVSDGKEYCNDCGKKTPGLRKSKRRIRRGN